MPISWPIGREKALALDQKVDKDKFFTVFKFKKFNI